MDPRLTSLTLEKLLRALADFLMPRVCLACGRQLLASEEHLCTTCMAELPLTHYCGMSHNPMADKFNSLVQAPGYERASALIFYSDNYRKITQSLKYGRNFAAGRFFARMLGEELAEGGCAGGFDIICPVPLHWTRRFSRGYNQAEIIAREVAGVLGAACEPRLLRRVRRTSSQVHFYADDRLRNVAGAFRVNEAVARKREAAGGGRALQILLIDDVFTTGATLASCAAALRERFGPDIRISAATIAYVE